MALAKVLELRRQGWSYRQIGRYAEHSGHAHPRPPFAAPTLFGSSPASTIDAKVFLRSLDAVEHGIAFYTPTGDLLHANRTFLRLLRPDPPEPRIELELMMFAPSIAAIAQVRSGGCVTSLMEGISTQRILVGTDLVNIRGSARVSP